MKVTLNHTEAKVGMLGFKKAPAIQLTVEFSELEQAVIKKNQLTEYTWYEPPLHNHFPERMQGPARIGSLGGGKTSTFHFNDVAQARLEEANLKEALKQLKTHLDKFAEPAVKSSTFEL